MNAEFTAYVDIPRMNAASAFTRDNKLQHATPGKATISHVEIHHGRDVTVGSRLSRLTPSAAVIFAGTHSPSPPSFLPSFLTIYPTRQIAVRTHIFVPPRLR